MSTVEETPVPKCPDSDQCCPDKDDCWAMDRQSKCCRCNCLENGGCNGEGGCDVG